MTFFHRHRWFEVHRYFVPPSAGRVRGTTAEVAETFLAGFTVIELRCHECGAISERRLTGDATHAA